MLQRKTAARLALGATLLAGCATSRVPGDLLEPEITSGIDAIARSAIDRDGIVGLSIGVAVDGRLSYARGFGHADLGRRVPASQRTVYDIASVGKHFTAAAILLLVENGELSLADRARDLIPELPAHFPNATVDQLLRHTSGFVTGEIDEGNPPEDYATKRYGLDLLTDVELQNGRTLFAPRETFVYSNSGYLVLGMLVEVASGLRYDRFVRERLLRPLGLDGMRVCERASAPRMSQAIHRSESGELTEVPFIDMTAYSGQAAVCSDVVDLLAWWHALNEGRVLRPSSLARMRSPSPLRGRSATLDAPYGMAQRLGELDGHVKVGHTGTFDGGSASLTYYPQRGLEVAVLSNTRGAGTPHARTYETRIARLLLGASEPDVEALRRPLSPETRSLVAGVYVNDARYTASFEGEDLVVSRDGKELERLVPVGGMTFRDPSNPDLVEHFVLDGDRVGWWVYNDGGNDVEVLRREELVIGPSDTARGRPGSEW